MHLGGGEWNDEPQHITTCPPSDEKKCKGYNDNGDDDDDNNNNNNSALSTINYKGLYPG